MIAFIIKSIISLFVIYILYKAFLAKENIPVFKRYFLLFGILFSIIVSLFNIEVGVSLPNVINSSVVHTQISEIYYSNPETLVSQSSSLVSISLVLYGLYFLITAFLFFRYISNVIHLLNSGRDNRNYTFEGYKIVVLDNPTPPCSFFNTIYVNNEDYMNGVIEKEILIHELVHVKQRHSIDILLIEFLQIIFWFNPLLWLFSKEIRLNHEYLADKQVIKLGVNASVYQNIILNFVFRNNSSYLASNFNYSLIKKRFIMLAKEKSSKRVFLKGAFIVPAILILAIVMSFSQSVMANGIGQANEWWLSILQKHNVEVKSYNNFDNIFEMGDQVSIENNVCKLTNATMLIKGKDNNYLFIEATHVERDMESGVLKFKSVTMKGYTNDSDLSAPIYVAEGEDVTMNIKDLVNNLPKN